MGWVLGQGFGFPVVKSLTANVLRAVLPCLVLAQLWMDPRAAGRLMLGCSTVASLCMYLQFLSDTVPDDTQGQAPLIGEPLAQRPRQGAIHILYVGR